MNIKYFQTVAFLLLLLCGKITAEQIAPPTATPLRKVYVAEMQEVSIKTLRASIEDTIKSFPGQYLQGSTFLSRCDGFEQRLEKLKNGQSPTTTERLKEQYRAYVNDLKAFQQEVMRSHPLVTAQPIVFIVRHPYKTSYHAIATIFPINEYYLWEDRPYKYHFQGGGAMKTIDFSKGGNVTTLIDLAEGVVRDPDVHFDGKKIVFSMRRHRDENYSIYEINADGTNLKQLTFAQDVVDFDPIYLPDDSIVFSSTREPKYNMCSRDHSANLFRMEADGANIFQITKNTLFDNHPSLMPDGRIMYARWEYVDRNFGDAHGIWSVNPDGTNQALLWGNNTPVPPAAYNNLNIPGTQQILSVLGPHHYDLSGFLAIIDRRLGIDGRKPIVRTWPASGADMCYSEGPTSCDAIRGGPYADPWPLSDKYFLCSKLISQGGHKGIFLIDIFGNETLLYDETPGCFDAMPVRPRKRPPVIPSRRNFENKNGYLYVTNVYEGTHMKGVKPGSVKSLRVVESPEKRHWSAGNWYGSGDQSPAMNWDSFENKKILGTVPVETDGSAYFEVPTDAFVFFQLLDANGMMIQSMRSGTVVQSGETTGCIGCHENRLTAPSTKQLMPLALQREPSKVEGWYGPAREFSYMAEVQPVFDKNCMSCHDFGKEAGKKLILAGDRDRAFNKSYTELWSKGRKYINCVGAGPAQIQQAYSWGSHASRLVQIIRDGHHDVKLSKEDFDRIVTWLDLNGVYYPTYASAYPGESLKQNVVAGRSPLDTKQDTRLAELTGAPLNWGDVSFDRPELSPCLAKIPDKNSEGYKEALSIIRQGQKTLKQRPRADMPGFVPCDFDRQREQQYDIRRQIELRNRNAIKEGRKVYDKERIRIDDDTKN